MLVKKVYLNFRARIHPRVCFELLEVYSMAINFPKILTFGQKFKKKIRFSKMSLSHQWVPNVHNKRFFAILGAPGDFNVQSLGGNGFLQVRIRIRLDFKIRHLCRSTRFWFVIWDNLFSIIYSYHVQWIMEVFLRLRGWKSRINQHYIHQD